MAAPVVGGHTAVAAASEDVQIRVSGSSRYPGCINGVYAVDGTRNGRNCYSHPDGSPGTLFFHGNHWRLCNAGESGLSETGWNFSQSEGRRMLIPSGPVRSPACCVLPCAACVCVLPPCPADMCCARC